MEDIGSRLLVVLLVFYFGREIQRGLKNKKIDAGVNSNKSIVIYKNKSPIMYWTFIIIMVLLIIFLIFGLFIDFLSIFCKFV